MSKAQWDKPAWMAKEGPHTIRIGRRGDMETRPSEALDAVYTKLYERADVCREQIHKIESERRKAKLAHNKILLRRLAKRQRQIEAELKAIRRQEMNVYLPRYEAEFLRVARLILDNETLQKIENIIIESIGMPPRYWNTFLMKKGYGWVDRSTHDKG